MTDTQTVNLAKHGITASRVHANLGTAALYEHAARRGEGKLTASGALAVVTSPHTGRSPKDKFVVEEPSSVDRIWWDKNEKFSAEKFDRLLADVQTHLSGQS